MTWLTEHEAERPRLCAVAEFDEAVDEADLRGVGVGVLRRDSRVAGANLCLDGLDDELGVVWPRDIVEAALDEAPHFVEVVRGVKVDEARQRAGVLAGAARLGRRDGGAQEVEHDDGVLAAVVRRVDAIRAK
jgi:hypothetical protein